LSQKTKLHLLVWASVRVLGAGRVEQCGSGGFWAQVVLVGRSGRRAGTKKRKKEKESEKKFIHQGCK
jgi:hypothetical protein